MANQSESRTNGNGSSSRPRRERQQDAAEFISGGDLDTSMFWFGDLNVWGAFPTAPTVYQKPRAQVFYVTRNWFERSVFLKAMILLKYDLYNYGFRVTAGAAPDGGDDDAQDKWQRQTERVNKWYEANRAAVTRLVRDAWEEWLIMDNAIAVWMKGSPAVIYPVEHLTFQDDFGVEALSFAHGLSPEFIKQAPGIPIETKRVLAAGKDLMLMKNGPVRDPKALFAFQTAKRTKVGMGLAWPQIRTLFNTVGTWESLELADWQLADALRTVYELHQVGHEIKNGNRAGWPDHFLKKKRADAINRMIKPNKQLLATIKRLVVNFDHQITYPRPDPKHFSHERYEAAMERLMLWAMPVAQMLFAKQVNPWHGPFLLAKATTERRDYMGPFIEALLRDSLGAPDGIRVEWSNDLFSDPRLMLDTLKTGLSSGPLSQETFLEKTGHNVSLERNRKDKENDLPEHQTKPIYDPAHGAVEAEAGRPAGKGDGRQRKTKAKA